MMPKQYIELIKNRKKCKCKLCHREDNRSFDKHNCSCQGSGFEPLTLVFPKKVLRCKDCNGTGKIHHCKESGSDCYSELCNHVECNGSGLIYKEGEEYQIEVGQSGIKGKQYAIIKILSLERKRWNELYSKDFKLEVVNVVLKEFGELKDDEGMIVVKI